MGIRRVISSSMFWKHLRKIGIEFPVKPYGPGLFFFGKIFIAYSIHFLTDGCSDFLFLHVFSLGMFLGIYPFNWAVWFVGA